jgi:predicted amidohydrolase YtcJ
MLKKLAFFLLFATPFASATDVIVINANVITVDQSRPSAEAFAIDSGHFVAVGTNSEVLKLKTASTKVIDLHGMTVTPGFNDAHLHPQPLFAEGTPHYRVWLGADKTHTIDEAVAALKRQAKVTPAGKMISGYGYNDVVLGRHPNRHDLDKVSTTQPIVITHGSGHITVVNSFVLQASGITKDTPDPPGGALDRDPDGTPNGVVRESARRLIARGTGSENRDQLTHSDELTGYMTCFRQYSAKGITSVGIAGASPSTFRVMQELRDIEHASVMNQSLLDRAKKDGVILVFHSYMWEYGDILQSYGPDRLAMMHAYRTALDMGIPVAGHSDSPISAADPLLRIQDMVTRTSSHGLVVGPQQRVTVDQAIKVWTLDGAYTTFEEKIKGSITPGKLGDFVVLAKDPRKVPSNTIKDIALEATYMGGEKVYAAPPNAVAMISQPPINYGDGNYGDGDEEENQNPPQ